MCNIYYIPTELLWEDSKLRAIFTALKETYPQVREIAMNAYSKTTTGELGKSEFKATSGILILCGFLVILAARLRGRKVHLRD